MSCCGSILRIFVKVERRFTGSLIYGEPGSTLLSQKHATTLEVTVTRPTRRESKSAAKSLPAALVVKLALKNPQHQTVGE
jgi:hypothetical protein